MSNIRIKATREAMKAAGVDLLALGPGPHMQWLLGFHPHPDERPCLLLLNQTNECFLMPILNAEGTREETDFKFYTYGDETGPREALTAALSFMSADKIKTLSLDETMRTDFSLLLMNMLPHAKAELATKILSPQRMMKADYELEELRVNAKFADQAMLAAFDGIKAGMSEMDVANIIKASFIDNGVSPLFYIVGSGKNGAYPHHSASEKIIEDGDAIVIDLGGSTGVYSSDITRMAIIGDGPDEYDKIYDIVERSIAAGIAAAKPGVKASEVDKAARDIIEDEGYGDYFNNRVGHGLGIEYHEPPDISASSDVVLKEGMVFTIEPGIYLPGRFGIRLEEAVIMGVDGVELLSKLPRDTKRIKA